MEWHSQMGQYDHMATDCRGEDPYSRDEGTFDRKLGPSRKYAELSCDPASSLSVFMLTMLCFLQPEI